MNTSAISERTKSSALSSRANWLKQVRQLHLYLGTFFAPSILFFALTGALQLFGLHEGHPGEKYQPPAWVAKLGSIHKDQTIAERRGPPRGSAGGQMRPPGARSEGARAPQGEGRRPNEGQQESEFTFALKVLLSRNVPRFDFHHIARNLHGLQIQSEPCSHLELAVNRHRYPGSTHRHDWYSVMIVASRAEHS